MKVDTLARAVPEPVRPSTSTTASVLAGAGVTVAVYVLEQFLSAPLPATIVAALTTLATAGIGYFFYGGRSRETI